MHEADESEWNILNLNDGEADHLKRISEDISHHLSSAENATVTTLNGLMAQETPACWFNGDIALNIFT